MSTESEIINELQDRTNRMAFIIGNIWGGLHELVNQPHVPMCQKEPLINMLNFLRDNIEKLFYNETKDEPHETK